MRRAVVAALLALACIPAHALDHAHSAWEALLRKHVRYIDGGNASQVSYSGFARERAALKSVLDEYQAVRREEFDA